MKNKLYIFASFFFIFLIGCNKESEESLPVPNNVENLHGTAVEGGVLLEWNIPENANYMYLEVSYDKNGKKITQNVPSGESGVLIEGLLNKHEYTFEIQPFIRGLKDLVSGSSVFLKEAIRPLPRPTLVVNYPRDLTKVNVTNNMLETFTQEATEGPKENLVDGDKETFWHSAWSSGVSPLPHWIKISFDTPVKIGVIKYYLRQNISNTAGHPSQFGVEISEDGDKWDRVWTSESGLAVDSPADEKTLVLDQNYESKYFRVMILQNPGNTTFTHLGEISFYEMRSELTDLEKEAEELYL